MFKFFKSPEGIVEYQKIGKEYEEHVNDMMFRHHHQLIDWDPNKTEVINTITRVKLWNGEEYLVWSDTSIGADKIYGQPHTFYRSNLGRYIRFETTKTRIPNPEFEANRNLEFNLDNNNNNEGKPTDFGHLEPFKEVVSVTGETEAYSLPYTKANVEDLHKKCNNKTIYNVAKENGSTILVNNYESFRDGDFTTLFTYGSIPNKDDKQRMDNINRLRQTAQTTKTMMEAIV